MNARNLGILAGVMAVVGGLAALAVYRERSAVAPASELGVLLPGLASKVNDASEIEVRSGEKAVTVRRDPARADGAWTVQELGGYPAKFEKVKGLLVGLAELEKVEPRTDKPESYEKIGVQAPAPGNTAMLVRVSATSGPLGELIVGKAKPGGSKPHIYARLADQEQSWLVSGELGATADALEWVDRQVVQIESTRIKSAAVAQPDGTRLVVSRPTHEGTYQVESIPEGRTLKTQNAASPVAQALASVNFDGVKPAPDVAFDPAAQVAAEYRTFDGVVVAVATIEQEAAVWARLAASFDEGALPPAVAPLPSDGHEPTEEEKAAAQAAAEEARQRQIDAVKKEVETLNGKWSPWAFQIPKAKADQFRRKMEDLLAEVPKEGPQDGATPDEPAPDEVDPFGVPPEEPQNAEDGSAGGGG